MRVIDLCSGMGGATRAFRDRGHTVITVDIDPGFNPDIVADVRKLSADDFPFMPDFIWASPPCEEFSRMSMPWLNKPRLVPDMSIVLACVRLINELKPRYWVIENVRGAVPYFHPYLGPPIKRCGPYYLWGKFPIFDVRITKRKQNLSGLNPAKRAEIPYTLSLALCLAIEREIRGDKA